MLFLSRLLYQFSLHLYRAGISLAAGLGNPKARLWITGRKAWQQRLVQAVAGWPAGPRVWLHAASLGEFEQGRPVLEALKKKFPGCRVVLTFFSPSGYEQQKEFRDADLIAYLPLDTPANARQFLDLVRPDAALFVKYEFWYFYLRELQRRKIPTLLFSAAFREDQIFFKAYGALFRQMLGWYQTIQVQDENSLRLLKNLQPAKPLLIGGDTRYDRVLAIAAQAKNLDKMVRFKGADQLFIAGSTWPADEQLLRQWLQQQPANWKLVLAPHEIDEAHLAGIEKLFAGNTVRYSRFTGDGNASVLIVDNIGMLSSLYRYGDLAFIGGGFTSGIHNTLEPAVFGLPVIMGPKYEKYSEARLLVAHQYAVAVKDAGELKSSFENLTPQLATLRPAIRAFVAAQAGATDNVLDWLNKETVLKTVVRTKTER